MSDPHWIEKATSKNKGSFAASAKKAGLSTGKFAAKKKDAPGVLGKRARLASTLMNLNHGN